MSDRELGKSMLAAWLDDNDDDDDDDYIKNLYIYIRYYILGFLAQLAGAAEYTDCISAKG